MLLFGWMYIKCGFQTYIPGFSCTTLGNQKIWQILKSKGVKTTRTTVMNVVKELDPEGVLSMRKKRLRRRCYSVPGPDFICHIDGYDKLKSYSFSISGCIDGFSWRIIWLTKIHLLLPVISFCSKGNAWRTH